MVDQRVFELNLFTGHPVLVLANKVTVAATVFLRTDAESPIGKSTENFGNLNHRADIVELFNEIGNLLFQ